MKSFSYTYVFAAVVAALVAYAIFDQHQSEKATQAQAEAEKIFTVSANEITRISVTRPNEVMVINHEKGQWSLAEPLVDEIEAEAGTAYWESMASEKATPVFSEKKGDINWANYNLSPPGAAIEMTKSDGGKVAFSVSKMAAFDGSYFIRRGDELLLGSTGWAKVLEKGSNQLRSKKVLRQSETVTKVRIENSLPESKDKFTLVRQEDKSWQVAEAPGLEIDTEKVQNYIENLKGLRALDFQPEKLDQTARQKYSLNSVVAKVVLDFEKRPEPWRIEVGAKKDGAHYGVSSSLDAIFKLSENDSERIWRDRNYFRNGKAPFRFPMEQASEIRVKAEAGKWTFKKDGTSWNLVAEPGSVADSSSLERLVQGISTLEAKEFYPKAKGLKVDGSRQVDFLGADGKSLLSVSFGERFTPQAGAHKGSEMTYVKSSQSPEILAITAGDLSAIPFDQLVKSAAAAKPDAQSEQQ